MAIHVIRAATSLPPLTAPITPLRTTSARHMIAPFGTIHQRMARHAPLPTVFGCELQRRIERCIVRTVPCVRRVFADDARLTTALRARRDIPADVFGRNKRRARGLRAVDSVFGRVFFGFRRELRQLVFCEIRCCKGQRDLLPAAAGRIELFVRAGLDEEVA